MPMATRLSHRHGTLPPEFAAWIAIRSRDSANEVWCSFVDFYLDVGPRPSWRHLLIRDNPTGEFGPSNARWQVGRSYRWRRPTIGMRNSMTVALNTLFGPVLRR